MQTAWNPRYVAFARAHGRTPDAQLAADHERGHMLDFVDWMGARWREWKAEQGRTPESPIWPADHPAFDAWLAAQVDVPAQLDLIAA